MQTLHLISHTHWDREWYLTFQQFRVKLVHLVDHVLRLLESDPQYRYFMLDGQTIVLEDYLEVRPEKEALLRSYIQSGRLLVGPWYVLPDEFLVSPEALIRNLFISQHLSTHFGPQMSIGYLPDTFGHISQMPQLLRGFGFETASLWRGLADEPSEFWWGSPDGSKVFMAYMRDGYGNGANLPVGDKQQFEKAIFALRDELAPHSSASHLLIMHGVDHMEPPDQTSAAIAVFNTDHKDGSIQLVHSTLPAYLAAVQADIGSSTVALPTVAGELRACQRAPLLPGVLSTRIWIKQRNQACQTLLEKWAEPFSAWASLLLDQGKDTGTGPQDSAALSSRLVKPDQLIHQAWRMLVQCHPHDSICGCSIDQVHAEMRSRFDQVEQIGEEITHQSLGSLAALVDTRSANLGDALGAVTVFNPVNGPRTDWVDVDLSLLDKVKQFEIVDEGGHPQPFKTQGSSREELVNMVMTSKEFRDSISMISGGTVMNWVISGFKLTREDDIVSLELTFAEVGEPDMAAIRSGEQQIQAFLADPAITQFAIRASSPAITRLSMLASGVPGHGYRSFWVRSVPGKQSDPVQVRLNPFVRALLPITRRLAGLPFVQGWLASQPKTPSNQPPFQIENEFFLVEASPDDGSLTVSDKQNGVTYRGLNAFVDGGDCGDEYNFSPPPQDTIVRSVEVLQARVEMADFRQLIHLSLRMAVPAQLTADRQSRGTQKTILDIETTISIAPGLPRIDIRTEVNNTAQDHRLRVHFPVPYKGLTADYDGHFEVVRRPITGSPDGNLPYPDDSWVEQPRAEVPQRAFTDLAGEKYSLLVANRGLPEVAVLAPQPGKNEIALTLLRCVGWLSRQDLATRKGHAGPANVTPEAQLPGRHIFDYAIVPHTPSDRFQAFHQAYAFNAPLRAVFTGLHAGELSDSASLVQVTPVDFVISAIKISEDGRGWLVRGYNISREAINVTLKPWKPFSHVSRASMAEVAQENLASAPDGTVQFLVQPFQVYSVLFSAKT